jgi:hypothetical protein
LNLKHDELLSSFAFNFNLRRYNKEDEENIMRGRAVQVQTT